jgi:hypothetical protein
VVEVVKVVEVLEVERRVETPELERARVGDAPVSRAPGCSSG